MGGKNKKGCLSAIQCTPQKNVCPTPPPRERAFPEVGGKERKGGEKRGLLGDGGEPRLAERT